MSELYKEIMNLKQIKEDSKKKDIEFFSKLIVEQIKVGVSKKEEIIKLYRYRDSRSSIKYCMFTDTEKEIISEILEEMNIEYRTIKLEIYIYIGEENKDSVEMFDNYFERLKKENKIIGISFLLTLLFTGITIYEIVMKYNVYLILFTVFIAILSYLIAKLVANKIIAVGK